MRYLVLLLLAGCATVTNSIGTATQLNTAALTAAVSLAQSGAISSKQLAEVTNVTNGVEAALVLAEQASNAGNSATASATYTAVMATLTAVTACLTPKAPASTIDACIVGVP